MTVFTGILKQGDGIYVHSNTASNEFAKEVWENGDTDARAWRYNVQNRKDKRYQDRVHSEDLAIRAMEMGAKNKAGQQLQGGQNYEAVYGQRPIMTTYGRARPEDPKDGKSYPSCSTNSNLPGGASCARTASELHITVRTFDANGHVLP
jgi:hypothetical protein